MKTVGGSVLTTQEKLGHVICCLMFFQAFMKRRVLTQIFVFGRRPSVWG